MSKKRFQVALSFPGEQRTYVEEVAQLLANALGQDAVFYDEWHKAELARPNLSSYLQAIYHQDSQLIVPFLCADYQQKPWCGLELRPIQDLIKNRQYHDIMPLRFDDAVVEGFFSIDGYIDLRKHSPEETADLILKRLQLNEGLDRKPQNQQRIQTNRLPATLGQFFGRTQELKLLDDALADHNTRIVQFIAPGGTGKTKLLQHWLDQHKDLPVLIAWSFYSQGSSDDKHITATPFFEHVFDKLNAEKREFRSEEDKGEYLAELLSRSPSVLVLDGLEPLQHGGFGMRGELKDRAIRALLKTLAGSHQHTFCVITTRLAVLDIHERSTVLSHDLHNLALADGVALLQSLNVKGRQAQLEQAVEEYGHHALALSLLGNALATFHNGDVQKRDLLKDLVDDEGESSSRHAFKVMQAYSDWLSGTTELQLLQVLGLFDHPVSIEVIKMLWEAKIPGLTAPAEETEQGDNLPLYKRRIVRDLSKQISPNPSFPKRGTEGVPFKTWQIAIKALRDDHHLLLAQTGDSELLDCHPLLREYFGQRLKQQPRVWQQAHRRLYDYYKALPEKLLPDTLSEMQPLFAAISHGCAAGLQQQVLDEVYCPRVRREGKNYLCKKLGAFSDDLAAVAHFFSSPWQQPASALTEDYQAVVLNWAGFRLRALGRLTEAVQPMQASLAMRVKQEVLQEAAKDANNLSELCLTLGDLAQAKHYGKQEVDYAELSGDLFYRMLSRTAHAYALMQGGELPAALVLFQQAEQLQQQDQPEYPSLYSLAGFQYCNLLLAQGEVDAVLARAEQALLIAQQNNWLLSIALDQLSLGLAHNLLAYPATACQPQSIAASDTIDAQPSTNTPNHAQLALTFLEQAVAGLRVAGQQDYLPLALLARATHNRLQQNYTPAQKDLAEVLDIAEPAKMRLHLCDYHLESARLALAENNPNTATDHCNKAEQLIKDTGYNLRLPELQALQTMVGAIPCGCPDGVQP
ncbi:MAG TPA: TIR domain-containing protein [Methylobacter sp.]|jgi:hypothetical protein